MKVLYVTDVVGIFPNGRSAERLVTMLLVEQNDEWAVNRRYFSLESMQQLHPRLSSPTRRMCWLRLPGLTGVTTQNTMTFIHDLTGR